MARTAKVKVESAIKKFDEKYGDWIRGFAYVSRLEEREGAVVIVSSEPLILKIQQLIQEKVKCRICFEVETNN